MKSGLGLDIVKTWKAPAVATKTFGTTQFRSFLPQVLNEDTISDVYYIVEPPSSLLGPVLLSSKRYAFVIEARAG